MPEPLGAAVGEPIDLDTLNTEFEEIFWKLTGPGFWKLERQQFFREPGNDSWEAFAGGDWAGSLRILEDSRQGMIEYHRKVDSHGIDMRRVRVVERPIIPYVQWELNALRIRDESGGPVRVIGSEQVTPVEHGTPLPEIYTLDDVVMYQAIYDSEGILRSALRFVDRDLIIRCQRFIEDLYDRGEPLETYFARHVAGLPAPASG